MVEEDDDNRRGDGGGQAGGCGMNGAERQAGEDDGQVAERRLGEQRLAAERRHQPLAIAQHLGGDEGAEAFGLVERAGGEALEEDLAVEALGVSSSASRSASSSSSNGFLDLDDGFSGVSFGA